jgi:hypothetical protein
VEAVEKVTRSSVAVAQRSTLTARVDALLKAYLCRTENLTVAAKKFGIEPVRRDRNNHEHEGLADSLRTLLQNIEANQAAVLAKGRT